LRQDLNPKDKSLEVWRNERFQQCGAAAIQEENFVASENVTRMERAVASCGSLNLRDKSAHGAESRAQRELFIEKLRHVTRLRLIALNMRPPEYPAVISTDNPRDQVRASLYLQLQLTKHEGVIALVRVN